MPIDYGSNSVTTSGNITATTGIFTASSGTIFTATSGIFTSASGTTFTVTSGVFTNLSIGGNSFAYATAAQAQNGVLTNVVLNPSAGRDAAASVSELLPTNGGAVSPGTLTTYPWTIRMQTGNSPPSTGTVLVYPNTLATAYPLFGASTANVGAVDWSRPQFIEVRMTLAGGGSTNSVFRLMYGGKVFPLGIGAQTVRGIGFEIRNQRIWLTAHNGTSQTTSDTSTDIATGIYRVTSDGSGNVSLFKNNTQIGTTITGGPTTAGTSVALVSYEVTNGGDGTNTDIVISIAKFSTI